MIGIVKHLVRNNLQSAIHDLKCSGWLSRPGSQKLGAKWVEVRKRRARLPEMVGERI